MSEVTALVNLVMGMAYLAIGVMVVIDLQRGWKVLGASHFGVAMAGLAFTCGPHHVDHALHIFVGDRTGRPLDLVTVLVGVVPGVVFVRLRTEAFLGGPGDRAIRSTPWWMAALPTLSGAYLASLVAAGLPVADRGFDATVQVVPNLALVGVYGAIGWAMLRTQLRNHHQTGTWSLSGLSLMAIFPTCAAMHATWALYGSTGLYEFDVHGYAITWISVPAGLYFLSVVRALTRDAIRDWNRPAARRTFLQHHRPITEAPT